jgi:hypothetical protein
LHEGSLIVFSRGVRHIVHDNRKAVFMWLPLMPPAPVVPVADTARSSEVQSSMTEESRTFW